MSSRFLFDSVKLHEGLELRAYQDTVGVWTIGYGTNLEWLGLPSDYASKLEISSSTAEAWLQFALLDAERDVRGHVWFPKLSTARRDAVVEMVYNLGVTRFNRFTNTIEALRAGDFEEAEYQALDSRWADQVGMRAIRLAGQLRTGVHWNAS